MTRFALGLKCGRGFSGAAKSLSLSSDARARMPGPMLARPKKWRRVIKAACSSRGFMGFTVCTTRTSLANNCLVQVEDQVRHRRVRRQFGHIQLLAALR